MNDGKSENKMQKLKAKAMIRQQYASRNFEKFTATEERSCKTLRN